MSNSKKPDFFDNLVTLTESLLTRRARRTEAKRRRQKARGTVMEWVDAFVWAVMVVLLLNQYLLQAYQIPSGSMRHTLIGGPDPYTGQISTSDRIFVDKLTFGPELLPSIGKIRGFRQPRRGEVIIFENPEFESRSVAFEIAQRVLYMASLSFIDLNRKNGETAHQFLIKRLVAEDGDRIVFREGRLMIRPVGEDRFIPEEDLKQWSGLGYGKHLLLDPAYYEKLHATIEGIQLQRAGMVVDRDLAERASANWVSPLKKYVADGYEERRIESGVLRTLYSYNEQVAFADATFERGVYVPRGWALPLGDNRSDSLDGRYFGPVRSRDILGRALFIYWPLNRIRGIR